MSENRAGFRFHPWRPSREAFPGQSDTKSASDIAGGGRKTGFPSAMFQGSGAKGWPERTVITDGGWVRPSAEGWNLPPEKPLGPSADGNIRRVTAVSAGGCNKAARGSSAAFVLWKKGMPETVDSREAAKKYGGRVEGWSEL